jgi:Protein of unknown function (DUF3102)
MLLSAFDYTSLDSETAELAKRVADKIRTQKRQVIAGIITIGKDLESLKERLGHGLFGEWLRREFGWHERTAQRFMQAAAVFGTKSDTVSDLSPTTLYLLSAKSTPEAIREKVIAKLEAGEPVDHARVRVEVRGARQRTKEARIEMMLSAGLSKDRAEPSKRSRAVDELAAKKQTAETAASQQRLLLASDAGEPRSNNPISQAWMRAKVSERMEFVQAHWRDIMWVRDRQGGAALATSMSPVPSLDALPADTLVITKAEAKGTQA